MWTFYASSDANYTKESLNLENSLNGDSHPADRPRDTYLSFILPSSGSLWSTLSLVELGVERPPCWVFLSKGSGKKGRPSHLDSIKCDFTYHAQIIGSKAWLLRGTEAVGGGEGRVVVEEGDYLFIDTSKWWHCTEPGSGESVSVARDCDLNGVDDDDRKSDSDEVVNGGLQNVDGLYATRSLEEGDVAFTEDDAPNAEIGRSIDPNCEVVEDEHGRMAVIAQRRIEEGEFFTIFESDDESEYEDEDDEMSLDD